MPALPSRFAIFTLTFATLFTVSNGSAWAQDRPLASVSAGFATLVEGDLTMPGFYVEGEGRLTRMVSVVGQVHRMTGSGQGYFSTIDWTDLFAGGGIRVSGRPAPWFEPYAQVLVGSYQVRTVERALPPRFSFLGVGTSGTYTDKDIATVAGGGVTLMPTPHFGLRVGADLQFFPGALPNLRAVMGVVVPIGRR